ncbi:MAG TPA: hypothetical protein VKC54_02140 [Patescibacteria group bacterium]|nr:hypothetical protein [Patescibacteria group bacterium]
MRKNLKYKEENFVGKYRNFILLVVCGVLAISSVITTIGVSVSGAQISDLQKKEVILASEKRTLEGQLVKTSSVSELQTKSADLGFIKPSDIVYLSQSLPVANIP